MQGQCCSSPVASVHTRSNLHTCTVLPRVFQLYTCVHFLQRKEELKFSCSLSVYCMLFWWDSSVIFIGVLRLFLRTVLLCFFFVLLYVCMFLLNWKNKRFQTLCRKLYVLLSELLIKHLLGKLPAVFLFVRIILTSFFLPQNQSEHKANITEPNWNKRENEAFCTGDDQYEYHG